MCKEEEEEEEGMDKEANGGYRAAGYTKREEEVL
jgi:hypothetical protein